MNYLQKSLVKELTVKDRVHLFYSDQKQIQSNSSAAVQKFPTRIPPSSTVFWQSVVSVTASSA